MAAGSMAKASTHEKVGHTSQGLCAVDGCATPSKHDGLCGPHYHRRRRHGDPLGGGRPHVPGARCERDDCDEPHRSRGLCQRHYNEALRDARPQCAVDGCDQQARSRDWCGRHYQRWKKYGDPLAGPAFRRRRGTGLPRWVYDQRREEQHLAADPEMLAYVTILRADPCSYCGARCEHVDHIDAFVAGGPFTVENVTAACAPCNLRKQATPLLLFMLGRTGGR